MARGPHHPLLYIKTVWGRDHGYYRRQECRCRQLRVSSHKVYVLITHPGSLRKVRLLKCFTYIRSFVPHSDSEIVRACGISPNYK